jgi:ATP-binding cassette subfamily C protein CydC
LALARALLANFQVLILDEPTANVDATQADRLMEDIFEILREGQSRAILLISHEGKYRSLVDEEIRLP